MSASVFQFYPVTRGPSSAVHSVHRSSTVAEACDNKAPLWSDGICPLNNLAVIATHQSVKGLHN